jgi:glycosyltransferase involved in cell wall biosynthesis
MKGYQKIIGPYGWEESKFPDEYVSWFNTKLTMIFSMSLYVERLLADNGVGVPIVTTGVIVENILNIESKGFNFELPSGFRLLHISSAFPRKGVDILLSAFDSLETTKEFSLIIKTFQNPHNNIISQLENLNYTLEVMYEKDVYLYLKNQRKILLINKDISQEQIKYLYQNTNLLVAPSFGEGFGLPMAESMLLELPVLTTKYGGQTDFCTPETSWLLDFDFKYAITHMNLENSLWAVPKISSIQNKILKISSLSKDELQKKTYLGKRNILYKYSSQKVSQNIINALKRYPKEQPKEKIALFSTYNTKCGIAQYSKYLISSFSNEVIIFANEIDNKLILDNQNIIRCWKDSRDTKDIEKLKKLILQKKITQLIIQYNFSFLPLSLLAELIEFSKKHNILTYLFLHSTQDVCGADYIDSFGQITKALSDSKTIYVHTLFDMNYLKNLGIYRNTYLFTHGINYIPKVKALKKINTIPVLATFGFLLPQKNILELVDIVEEIHIRGVKVKLLLLTSIHPVPISKKLEKQLKQKIKNSSIREYIEFDSSYLDEKEVIFRLEQADKILFLYNKTQESSSAAIRTGLLALKEVITTPNPIFNDVSSIITQTKDYSKNNIVETIINSLNTEYDSSKHQMFLEKNSWKIISKKFRNTLFSHTNKI